MLRAKLLVFFAICCFTLNNTFANNPFETLPPNPASDFFNAALGTNSTCPCDGHMTDLTVRYHGPGGVTINVYNKSGHDILIASFTNVQDGQILYVSAAGLSGDDFESNTYYEIVGGNETAIHTSCSKDIMGNTYGEFEVLAYTDGHGNVCGPVCDLDVALQSQGGGCSGTPGTITSTVTGGTAPYTYTWSNGETTADISGLPNGNYSVTVNDAGSCSATATATVGNITLSSVETNPVCAGSPSGTIDLTIAGGSAPYSFAWSDGGTTEDRDSLYAGNYTVTVTDAAGCDQTLSATLTNPAQPCSGMVCFQNPDDPGVVNANSRWTISWSTSGTMLTVRTSLGKGFTDNTYGNTAVGWPGGHSFNQLVGSDHLIVSLYDNNGVEKIQVKMDLISSDGSVPSGYKTLGVWGGDGSMLVGDINDVLDVKTSLSENFNTFGYWLTQNSPATDTNYTPNPAYPDWIFDTWYEVTVDLSAFGAAGFGYPEVTGVHASPSKTGNNSETVVPGPCCDLEVTLDPTNISCTQQTGSVTAIATGGKPPLTYTWSNGETTPTITGLTAGTYSVTVTDSTGCSQVKSTMITAPNLQLSSVNSNPVCNGSASGTIDLTIDGGNPPYTITWSDGATTEDRDSLFAGVYTVTVADAGGCSQTLSATLTNPSQQCSGQVCFQSPTAPGVVAYSKWVITWTTSGNKLTVRTTLGKGFTDNTYGTNAINWPSGHSFNQLVGSDHLIVSLYDGNNNEAMQVKMDLLSSDGSVPSGYSTLGVWGGDGKMLIGDINDVLDVKTSLSENFNTYGYWLTQNSPATDTSYTPNPAYPNWIYDTWYEVTVDLGAFGAAGFDHPAVTGVHASPSKTGNNSEPVDSIPCCEMIVKANPVDGNCTVPGGSITLTITDGKPPYTYLWNTGDTTASLTGLSTGFYSVTVTDSTGCSDVDTASVTAGAPILAGASATDVSCFGGTDGTATAYYAGGTTPVTYAWSTTPTRTTQTITGLSAGTYYVTISDAAGCSDVDTAIVSQPGPLTLGAVPTSPQCHGASDGGINLTVTGGTPPFTFIWSTGATTEDLSNVTAGTYSVTVTDDHGCVATLTQTITEPDSISLTLDPTDLLCNGTSSGSIDLTVSGGTTPYTYAWNNGAGTEDLSGLAGGTYSVTVTDAHGCTGTGSTVVNEPSRITVTASGNNISCNGFNDGTASASATGGTPPYVFAWSLPGGVIDSSANLSGLAPGTYVVTVTDANGCVRGDHVTITQPPTLTATAGSTPVSCFGGSNGSAYVNASGGTAPYSYSWSTIPARTTDSITGLLAGPYSVTITDANGCTTTASTVVTQPSPLTLGAVPTAPNCNGGSDGSINLTVTGGTPGFTYIWSTGDTTEDVSGLSAGSYSVTVTDANGCMATLTQTVNQPQPITLTSTATPTQCNGGSDGSINLTVSGGTTPYTYAWSNGDTTQDISGLTAGAYFVTVTDAHGCTATANDTVNEPTEITVTVNKTDISCNGFNDGTASASATGGTPPYVFAWSLPGGVIDSSANLTGLAPGTYVVTVTDAHGCVRGKNITITQPSTLTATAGSTPVSCFGGSNGSAYVNAAGGTAPYTYLWSTLPARTTDSITGLLAGPYSVTITDANGCTTTASTVVTQPGPLTLGAVPTAPNCNGGSDGSINLTVTGGTPGFTYAWSTGDTTEDVSGLSAGSYSVTVTDANGCVATLTQTVNEPQPFTLTTVPTDVSCANSVTGAPQLTGLNADGKIDLTVSGGTSPYTYTWSNGDSTQDIANLDDGTYSVTVTDAHGCTATATDTVGAPPNLVLAVSDTDITCNGFNDGSALATVSGGTPPYTYNWTTLGDTTPGVSNLAPGVYPVTITDSKGCQRGRTVQITQPTTLTATAGSTPVSCFGGSNGSAYVNAAGGTAPYTYLWSTLPPKTTDSITGLLAGPYTVTITDANGCSTTASTVVTQPGPLTLGAVPTAPSCNGGSDGSINLTVTGGTPGFTYAWSTGDTTEDVSGLSAGSYSVTVTDANGCVATLTQTVNQPPAITLSSIATPTLCANYGPLNNSGSIDLTVSGGTSPYTYAWSNGDSIQDIDSLDNGIYSVTVTDAHGCTATHSDTINEPLPLNVSINKTNVSCYGSADGSATASASGGVAPYHFVWNTGDTTAAISSLAPGTYSVTATDANGCSNSGNVTITQPDSLTATAGSTPVSCFGGFDGTATVITINGGTPPATFAWSNGDSTMAITGLVAGPYTVTVTDANGCTTTATTVVTQPGPLTLGAVPTAPLCNGGSTGSIDLTVTGGTPGYDYVWSNGDTTQDISGIAAGQYSVTVTDTNGCVATLTQLVTQPPAITANVTPTDVTCNGFANGSIDLTVSGGTTPYTYNWSNGDTTQDITGLSQGQYFVTITDANGCTATADGRIFEPTALTATASSTPVSCFGGSNGTASVVASGGTAPYTYKWSTTPQRTTANITGLLAGPYSVTVTDANGCSVVRSTIVTQPGPLTLGAIPTAPLCFGGNNGSIDLTVTGGTPGFTYAWSTGDTTQDISGLTAGSYSVTVTDAHGCVATLTQLVNQPAKLTLTHTKVDVACNGDSTGSIDLSVSGGTSPFTYSWSNGATTQDLTGLPAGTYTVTVIGANGCSASDTATITQNPPLNSFTESGNVSCFGANDASGIVGVSGGVPPYTYLWSTGDTTDEINNLGPGSYSVTYTDAAGCTGTESFTVTQPTQLTASASSTNVDCNGGANGTITLTVSGGTPGYTFAWSNGATTQNQTGLAAGTYTVTVTDQNGCTATASTTITQPNALSLSSTSTEPQCNGDSTGSIDLSVSGGTTPYGYAWSNGDTTQDLSGLGAGVYTVTVTDAGGCSATLSDTITEPDALAFGATSSDVNCNGGSDGSVQFTLAGGTAPYAYLWNTGDTTATLTNLSAGTYSVTGTDAHGCQVSATFNINEPPALTASASSTPVSCFGGHDGTASSNVSGGTPPYTYVWSNGATTANITGLAAGPFSVTITDVKGCTTTANTVVTQPGPLTLGAIPTAPLCNGGSNGSINLTVTGGTPGFTYSWSTGDTTQDISGITAGQYSVTVTDANGCVATLTQSVTQPNLLTLTHTKVDVACNGSNTGSVDLSVSGGTSPYTYAWSNGATTQDLTGLGAGTYTVDVTDVNGCTASDTVTITQNGSFNSYTESSNVTCYGDADASGIVGVSGGTPPYTYLWSTGDTTDEINNLGPGTYTVTFTDAVGCFGTESFTVTQPDTLTASAVATEIACNGGQDATITLTVTGGTSPYTYAWSNGPTTQNQSGLGAGTYTVTVTDDNGCTAIASVTIGEPAAISLTTTNTEPSCHGDAGAIDLSVTGGTSPYAYLWSNGDTTQDLNNVLAGGYSVTVTDANGCTATAIDTLAEPEMLLLDATSHDVTCNGGSDGTAESYVNGGTPPYSFLWSNGDTTQDVTGLSAGDYIVTITDAHGCQDSIFYTISEPAALSASASSTPVSCFGGFDGTASASVSGGTAPYTYHWSNNGSTATITGLAAGQYSVTITDAHGCTTTTFTVVTQPGPLTLGANNTPVNCNGGADGTLDLSVTGGTPGFTYIWNTGDTTQDLTGLAAGTYSVTVTDANGCVATLSQAISQPPVISLVTTHTDVTFYGGSDGTIDLTVNGGTSPYTYSWSNGATTQDLTGLSAGTYCVTVVDLHGCTDTTCVTITEPQCGGFSTTTTTFEVNCFGDSDGFVSVTPSGGTTPYTYLWNTGDTTQSLDFVVAGIYTVTVTDSAGCSSIATDTVTQPDQIVVSSTLTHVTCFGDSTGSIILSATGGAGGYYYYWPQLNVGTDTLTGLPAGTYIVEIGDFHECSAMDTFVIQQPASGISVSLNTVTNVTCFGGTTGAINIDVSGGNPGYTYSWSNGRTTQDITGVGAGSYTVTVTDASGCTNVFTQVVTQPGPLTLGAVPTTPHCTGGTDGSIDLTVTGGTPGYTYLWSTGATTQDISGIPAGQYSVTVTDANGCVATLFQLVNAPQPITLTATTTSTCAGTTDGAIDMSVSGGTSPYTYLWSNGATTQDLTGLAPISYSVTVTDAFGCTGTNTFTVDTSIACRFRQVTFNTKVLLEGPLYLSNTGNVQPTGPTIPGGDIQYMQTILNTQCSKVPYKQPYGMVGYKGKEEVTALDPYIVDWVLVSFRTGEDANTTVYRTAALLRSDGQIVTADGSDVISFMALDTVSLYVVVQHRNHMGVMSPSKYSVSVADADNPFEVDFRHMQSFQKGAAANAKGTTGEKLVGHDASGRPVYAMMSGDGDGNFDINSSDIKDLLKDFNQFNVYSNGDYNMDCDCNSNDIPVWIKNFNNFSGVR